MSNKGMIDRMIWQIDMLLYRLWYWRWSPRLKRDPDLAYIFAKLSKGWTNGHPPSDPERLDKFIADVFERHGRPVIIERGDVKKCSVVLK